MNRRLVLAAALSMVGAIGAGTLASMSARSGTSMEPAVFREQVVACLGEDARPGIIEESSAQCARQVLLDFAENRSAPEVHTAIEELYRTHQPFASLCHTITHDAGALFARRHLETPGPLADVASEICVTGILHGYLETIGFSRPDDATIDRLIRECSNLRRELRIGCADGVGHLLYIRDPDISRSAAKCVTFPQVNERIQCSYGVVMFAGQLLPGAYPERPDLRQLPLDALPAICEEWPVEGAVGQYGCGMGLANLLVFPSGAQRSVAELDAGGHRLGDGSPQAAKVEAVLQGIFAACMELRSVPARLGCLNDSTRNMSRTHEYEFAAYSYACELLPEGYELACPGEFYSLGPMHDAGVHIQVEEALKAKAANQPNG
jgi:hypothetical protein